MRQRHQVARRVVSPDKPRSVAKPSAPPTDGSFGITWGLFTAGMVNAFRRRRMRDVLKVAVLWYWIYWTPTPLTREAPAGVFSEQRALEHVRVLSDEIGHRQVHAVRVAFWCTMVWQVSTHGLHEAAGYLLRECQSLVDLAERRPDLEATVCSRAVSIDDRDGL